MTDWRDRSLADLYRLLVALEQHGGDAFIQGLIDRIQLPADFAHPRITVRSLLQLLEQTDGCTTLPHEVAALLCVLNQAAAVQMPGIGINPALILPIRYEDPAEIVDMNPVIGEVTVDYNTPLADLIIASPVYWAHDKITDANFPGGFIPEQRVRIIAAKFNRCVSSNEAISVIGQHYGGRTANLRELVAVLRNSQFSCITPKLFGGSFVALGSRFFDGTNGWRYPFANCNGPTGSLQISLGKHGETALRWEKEDRFLYIPRPVMPGA